MKILLNKQDLERIIFEYLDRELADFETVLFDIERCEAQDISILIDMIAREEDDEF